MFSRDNQTSILFFTLFLEWKTSKTDFNSKLLKSVFV